MPSDIRSFFGGGGGPSAPVEKTPAKADKKSRRRKVVSDEEDDEPVKSKKTTTPKKKAAAPPKEEETTSSAYFTSTKAKSSTTKSTPIRTKPTANGVNGTTPSTGRRSARKSTRKSYAEDSDDAVKLEEDVGGDDDIHADDFKGRKAGDDYEEGSDDDEVVKARPRSKVAAKKVEDDDEDIEMAEIPATNDAGGSSRKKAGPSKSASRKRKTPDDDEDEDNFIDDDEEPKKKARKTTAKVATKKSAKEERVESKEIQDIFDSIPTIRAPTPPPRDEDRKFTFKPGGGNQNAAPLAAGSKEIPEGEDDCLIGLTFVLTGVLETLAREDAQSLIKRYGGKVTGAPSKKTSYVIVGADAGPKKLETIKQLGITTINEDGLFALIKKLPAHGGSGMGAEAAALKREKEEEKVRKEAEEMEEREKAREKQSRAEEAAKAKAIAARGGTTPASLPKPKGPKVEDRLWVDKYAPDSMGSVCGNKTQVEQLQLWLRNWHKNAKSGFSKAGATGKGIYRAAILHGPPGVGKTTAAHLVAKLEGYDVVETNASDTRSKKLMEATLRGVLDTTSLRGYFAGDGKKVESQKKNLVLIMDEVDGMSAGDRGGVGALAAVAKKTNIPLIFICNERRLPKMKPFDFVTADFQFRRPTTDQIRSRIAMICYREGIKLPLPVLNAIIEGSNADIRQIINMLSTIKIDYAERDMDFNDSKAMSKAWEKHVILKPWDIVSKIMRPQMFSGSSTATLNEKTELYFNDHEFSYLMLQENYLKSQPSLLNAYANPKERNLKYLELASKAAGSISDGDLVDRMIHGSQQQWSLMPLHAIFSFVTPASYVYGNFNAQVGFASWLGQNSKAGKLSRYVKEIQGHMRLRTSADRHEIRQQYVPALWEYTVKKLIEGGKEAVPEMIEFMDSYYLTKDDYDAIIELGVGPMNMEDAQGVKRVDTQTKATFTRLYNIQSHPMPFMKASNVLGVSKAAGKREKPDLEEAIEDSEGEDVAVDEAAGGTKEEQAGDEDEDMDISKDKYIKAPKKKAAPKAAKAGTAKKGKGKKGGADEDDEDDDEGDREIKTTPKKKGGAKGKGKGKA